MALQDQVKSILAEKLGLEIADIEDQSILEEDLGIDAITMTDILNTVKERTNVEVPDEDVRLTQTVEQFVNLVEENSPE